MSQSIATGIPSSVLERPLAHAKLTRAALACGVAAGPLFIVSSGAQALTRPGFDLRRHAISMLTLGDQGWMQRATFIVTGLLVLACAVGIRRTLRGGRAGTWGPLLFGGYGVGLVVAGLFTPDPALGFPAGAPAGMAPAMSGHAILHTIAFFVAFISLVAATFVFARRFAGLRDRRWLACCLATGVVPFPLIALSLALGGNGVVLFAMGAITSAWVTALPVRLTADLGGAAA
jgi:hypothetical membrane protein